MAVMGRPRVVAGVSGLLSRSFRPPGPLVFLLLLSVTAEPSIPVVGPDRSLAPAPSNSLFPGQIYDLSYSPAQLSAGDFNGDGHDDIAATNRGNVLTGSGRGVSILLGRGDGTLSPQVFIPTGPVPFSLVTADFNGDDRDDIAVGNGGTGGLSVFISRGDGTFQPEVIYVTEGSGGRAIAVGEFNGDTRMDVVLDSGSGFVSRFLGRGDGTFGSAARFQVGTLINSIGVGDFDRDGDLDLVVANLSSSSP